MSGRAAVPPRALDHVVVPCRDLAGAAQACADLGFTVGRRNRHPWGTENHLVQFPGAFLELVALAPDYRPLSSEDDAFPFAGFLAGQGASREPSGMIVLRSHDAAAVAGAFQVAGIGSGRTLHFARDGAAPDGATRTVAFTLAFAEAPAMPDLGFFVCEQHYPQNFWNPAMQRHSNGAAGVSAVVIEAARPQDHAAFLCRFAGAGEPVPQDGGLSVTLGEGCTIEIVPAPGLAAPRLAGLRFRGAAALRNVVTVGTLSGPAPGLPVTT